MLQFSFNALNWFIKACTGILSIINVYLFSCVSQIVGLLSLMWQARFFQLRWGMPHLTVMKGWRFSHRKHVMKLILDSTEYKISCKYNILVYVCMLYNNMTVNLFLPESPCLLVLFLILLRLLTLQLRIANQVEFFVYYFWCRKHYTRKPNWALTVIAKYLWFTL